MAALLANQSERSAQGPCEADVQHILHNMGTAQYGIWAVVTAAISMGSIIAAGFGDANIQHVASQRGLGRHDALVRTVRCMIGINLVLGTALAFVAWVLAPAAARHL